MTKSAPAISIKRIYEPFDPDDGQRILVDRIWPRGVSKVDARLDAWMPEVAPSTELRKWFGHDPERWYEFQLRYHRELGQNAAVEALQARMTQGPITLLYSARDEVHNQARALLGYLTEGG